MSDSLIRKDLFPLYVKKLYESGSICQFRCSGKSICLIALHNNPRALLLRICAVLKNISLDDTSQEPHILRFLFWLLETFLPFLTHYEQHLAGVLTQVDTYLSGNQFPPLAKIISTLVNHFTMVPKRLLCCIFVAKMCPTKLGRYDIGIPLNQYIAAFAIARLNGTGGQASDSEARRFGLTLDQLTKILVNLSHLIRIRGKSFRRRIHVVTIALNFLIRKFLGDKIECRSHLINRLLSGL